MHNKTNPWTIVLTILLTAIIVGGAFLLLQDQPKIETVEETPSDQPEVEIVETVEEESMSSFETYSSAVQSFAMDYPTDWQSTEGEVYGAFNVFFEDTDANSFGVLPKGELDYGIPQSEPELENVVISNNDAVKKTWHLANGEVLIIITFSEYPSSWNEDNRIQFSGTDMNVFEEMLESFQFTD